MPIRNPRLGLRALAFVAAFLLLAGCREVRVRTVAQGTTTSLGVDEIAVVRNPDQLARLGIRADIHFRSEFGVVLLMGPHNRTGYHQVIEHLLILASNQHLRVVVFEEPPLDGGEPSRDYRTYTLWIVPNSAYRSGVHVEAVTPSGEPIAETVLP